MALCAKEIFRVNPSLALPIIPKLLQERERVDGYVVFTHLKVQMGACRTAGITHTANNLSASHAIPWLHIDFRHVSVERRKATSMRNHHMLAIAVTQILNQRYLPAVCCGYGRGRSIGYI